MGQEGHSLNVCKCVNIHNCDRRDSSIPGGKYVYKYVVSTVLAMYSFRFPLLFCSVIIVYLSVGVKGRF